MKTLGIDPGSRFCGYAILGMIKGKNTPIEAGLVKIKSNTLQYQITELREGLDLISKHYHFDEVAIEDILFAYNPQSVLKLAQLRGVLSLKILQFHGEFAEYIPLRIKKTITGKAKASKGQVAFMAKRLFGISKGIKPLDITDAIAIALIHATHLRLRVQ